MRLSIVVLVTFAAACAPQLDGACRVDADCGRADEVCSGGICLRRDLGSGPIAVELTTPAAGAQLSRAFRVAAHLTGDAAVSDVTFIVANSANGAQLGQLSVTAGTAGVWSGSVTLDANSFGGAANVRAVAHRSGQPEVVSSAVAVIIDQNAPAISPAWSDEWHARDAGLSLEASIADDRTGVASAELQLPDGGTYPATIAGSKATFQVPSAHVGVPGAASVVPVSLSVTDVAGNRASVDGAVLRVDDEPPAVTLDPVSTTAWLGGALDVAANAGDNAGCGVATAQLLVGGHPAAADVPSGGSWHFHANLAELLPQTEGAVMLEVIATDRVGNAGSAWQTIQVDTVSPSISAVHIESTAEGRDAAGQDWFRGPSVAPAAGDIVVSAAIEDENLVTSGDSAPAAIAGGERYPGVAISGRWIFAIPRSAGLNATGPGSVTFAAQDLAGNHPVASPSAALYFDDVTPPAFKPVVAADSTWYGRSAVIRPGVALTFAALPRSGISSVVLQVADQPESTCVKTSGSAYSCSLPSLSAPASAETALQFQVVATSGTGIVSSASGSRNIDDAPPKFISPAPLPPYPATSGPLSWGHDGKHFNAREDGILYTFKAYDCGSGVKSAVGWVRPPASPVSLKDSGARWSCDNGTLAIIYDVPVSANLAALPAGTFPSVDNMLNVSATVVDAVTAATTGTHEASQTTPVSVTRRLWQTTPAGMTRLALGPLLIASSPTTVSGLRLADGTPVWSRGPANVLAPPVIGGQASAPVVYYATGSASDPGATLNQVFAVDGSSAASGCLVSASPPSNCDGGFRTHSVALALATDGTPVLADNSFVEEGTVPPNHDASCWSATYALSIGCSPWVAGAGHNLDAPFIGRQGRAFFIDTQVSRTGVRASALQERPLGGTTAASGPACNSIDLLTDVANADAPACGGARYAFDGANFAATWTGSGSPARTVPALDRFFAGDGTAYSLTDGNAIPGFNGAGRPLLIAGSSSPVLYSAAGTTLSALRISSNGYGPTAVGLPVIPGSAVDDALLDPRTGTLYIASNGQVSAIAVDPSDVAVGGTAWATRNRDNCRSNNLEFACPF